MSENASWQERFFRSFIDVLCLNNFHSFMTHFSCSLRVSEPIDEFLTLDVSRLCFRKKVQRSSYSHENFPIDRMRLSHHSWGIFITGAHRYSTGGFTFHHIIFNFELVCLHCTHQHKVVSSKELAKLFSATSHHDWKRNNFRNHSELHLSLIVLSKSHEQTQSFYVPQRALRVAMNKLLFPDGSC